ncbi:MAG: hypothetical protein IPL70_03940 [Uliginosibacterium sp.]|nr:hypothetical protein [Uliginosibacterium sp.]
MLDGREHAKIVEHENFRILTARPELDSLSELKVVKTTRLPRLVTVDHAGRATHCVHGVTAGA